MTQDHRFAVPFPRLLIRLLAVAALLAGTACASEPESRAASATRTGGSSAAEPTLRNDLLVSADWLAERLEDADLVILHVGGDREAYDAGHIPGARFLPQSALVREESGNSNELPPDAQLDSLFESVGVSDGSHVILYGAPLPAARAFFTLDYLGARRVSILDGGISAWESGSRPLSTASEEVATGTFTPDPRPRVVADAGWVRDHLDDPSVALIDARPAAQYSGAEAGADVDRPGHIPGARNLFWEETLESADSPVLKDPVALRELFSAAGVEPGDAVVTYCRTGMQASFAYFVARYLGYDTKMYDASFVDWSRRTELPVER